MARDKLPISIELPPHFLEEEVRCGYVVSSQMKKIWAVELDLLAKFDAVCKKHGITYVALWGTALGAVRHKGFIPWDDDIDVGMDRCNYDKLCKVAPMEFTHPYFFQNALTDRAFFIPLARLRNSETTAAIHGFDTPDYNNGIYIDIDILDGLAMSKLQWHLQNFLKHLLLIPIQAYYQKERLGENRFKKLCRFLRPCWHMLKYETWCTGYRKVRSMYTDSSVRMGISYSFLPSEWRSWMAKDEMTRVRRVRFEFMTIPIFESCGEYLSRCYDNYLEFPPEGERGTWHLEQVHFDPCVSYVDYLSKGV